MTIWATWGLALLAAGVVDHLVELVRDRQGRLGRAGAAVLLVPLVAVYAEGLDVVPSWEVAREPVPLAGLAQPVLVLPSNLVVDYHIMFWSTQGWPVMANGDSSFDAPQQAAMRQEAATFPDALSVAALRGRGVETVVVVRSRTGPGQWENAADAPVDGLGIGRVDTGDAVVFDLSPSGP